MSDDLICKMIYWSGKEKLFIWNDQNKQWIQADAVSGGGRGQYAGKYGASGERNATGRIANMGGTGSNLQGHPTQYGTIPNGVYEVKARKNDETLGQCFPLEPAAAAMMGRGGFYIHGRGNKGSEGCIIP